MAQTKLVSPSGWDFDQPTSTMLKFSHAGHGGLRGHDRREFIKMAGHALLDVVDNIKIHPDEMAVHQIALGGTRKWGANRNGDGFMEEIVQAQHDTFEKYAKLFRNHKNKPGDPYYGVIKRALYWPEMARVDLLNVYNIKQSAADRNGGFVADREIEKLAKDGELPGSMACRVAHDICSFCHNKAASRAEYCTAATCGAGGCRDNLAKLVKVGNDVHHVYVENPGAIFFDYSSVFKPADRTAYGVKADWLTKAA